MHKRGSEYPTTCTVNLSSYSILVSSPGVFKVWEGEPPLREHKNSRAPPLPIIIAIIIIVVVDIMQGYSIAFQKGPVRENVIKCSVFAVYLSLF